MVVAFARCVFLSLALLFSSYGDGVRTTSQWCLADCGNDAHPHVRGCEHSLARGRDDGYRGNHEEFERAQKHRRERMLRAYLETLDAAVRDQAVVDIACELRDLALDPKAFLSHAR